MATANKFNPVGVSFSGCLPQSRTGSYRKKEGQHADCAEGKAWGSKNNTSQVKNTDKDNCFTPVTMAMVEALQVVLEMLEYQGHNANVSVSFSRLESDTK